MFDRRIYNSHWVAQDRKKHLAEYHLYNKQWRQKTKLDAFALFGSVCQRCGFKDHRALQLDHKTRPNGRYDSKNFLHGTVLCRALLKGTVDVDDYQLLCANCNWIKKTENNEVGLYHGNARPQVSN